MLIQTHSDFLVVDFFSLSEGDLGKGANQKLTTE
jgi:hypothetical protein